MGAGLVSGLGSNKSGGVSFNISTVEPPLDSPVSSSGWLDVGCWLCVGSWGSQSIEVGGAARLILLMQLPRVKSALTGQLKTGWARSAGVL